MQYEALANRRQRTEATYNSSSGDFALQVMNETERQMTAFKSEISDVTEDSLRPLFGSGILRQSYVWKSKSLVLPMVLS